MMELNSLDKKVTVIFIAVCITLIISISGLIDKQSEIQERKNYCELVSMWEEGAELGIEPTKRDGHPNYKGISCEL